MPRPTGDVRLAAAAGSRGGAGGGMPHPHRLLIVMRHTMRHTDCALWSPARPDGPVKNAQCRLWSDSVPALHTKLHAPALRLLAQLVANHLGGATVSDGPPAGLRAGKAQSRGQLNSCPHPRYLGYRRRMTRLGQHAA